MKTFEISSTVEEMRRSEFSQHSPLSTFRICMPTWRNISRAACKCVQYEAADVLSDLVEVDFLPLKPASLFPIRRRVHGSLLWRGMGKQLNPGLRPIKLSRDYDAFVVLCQDPWDLPLINAIKDWKRRCRVSICWIEEVWTWNLEHLDALLSILNQFDHVFLCGSYSISPVSNRLGRACQYLPLAVDSLRFNPLPHLPKRVIDVYSMGRRFEGIHRELVRIARSGEIFYLFDTSSDAGIMQIADHRQHRDLLASVAQRSQFFMVAPSKIDMEAETHGQSGIGYRYFEGAAAGAVLLGTAPSCAAFNELFDWPDIVIPTSEDGADVEEILRELKAQPERMAEISSRNAREMLLRHDWVYRWRKMLEVAGLKPTPKLLQREAKLQELAETDVE